MKDKLHLHPGLSPAERSRVSAEMNRLRWAGTTAQERKAFARQIAINPAAERCPCGAMTLKRAAARADRNGKGLGHHPRCSFYRRQRHPGKRRPK